jgi:hypothetical protein
MNHGVQIAAFSVQIRKRRAKVTDLRRQAVFGVKIELLREFSRFDPIGADIDEHDDSPQSLNNVSFELSDLVLQIE